MQTWGVYTTNEAVFDPDLQKYDPVKDQVNIYIRRTRLGVLVKKDDWISLRLVGAFDNIGHNPLAGTVGGTNNGSFPVFGLWDAVFDLKISRKSDALHVLGGYYTPIVSRESVTSAFKVSSMEKSLSQTYIRQHLTGKGPGRTTGVTLGGILFNAAHTQGIKYAFGMHNPVFTTLGAEGSRPMWAGRLVWYCGQLEGQKFQMAEPVFSATKTNILTLGTSGTYQGETYLFKSSWSGGVDMHAQWQQFSLEGEWYFLGRNSADFSNVEQTGFLRAAAYLPFREKHLLEPTVMWMFFRGSMTGFEQLEAQTLGSFSGAESTVDAGVNWHLTKQKVKIYVHYNWRLADSGALGAGAANNLYFYQPGVEAIKRGNWLGIGVNVVL